MRDLSGSVRGYDGGDGVVTQRKCHKPQKAKNPPQAGFFEQGAGLGKSRATLALTPAGHETNNRTQFDGESVSQKAKNPP